MQFSARVDGSSACVRIKPSRLEWSLVGHEWVIQMAPMASISAVTSDVGLSRSNLVVTTTLGAVEFCIEAGATVEQARALLTRLVAAVGSSGAIETQTSDDLINMRWIDDPSTAASLEFYEEPALKIGF